MGLARRVVRKVPGLDAALLRRQRAELDALRRLRPVSRVWGADRGTPVDRVFVERFLDRHRRDITGRVLEVGDPGYTVRYGQGITQSDVLHVESGHTGVTLVGDLQTGAGIPRDTYDCMIVTQVLPFLYDFAGAIGTIHQALRPGGVVLATFPGISQISRYDLDRWGDYWRFTSAAAARLFAGFADVEVKAHGNVLLACAFLHGFAAEEVGSEAFEHDDRDYELLVTVRALRDS